MRTTTPFQQLLHSEIQRIRTVVTPRIAVPYVYAGFATYSSRYTIERMQSQNKTRKGFLSRVLGN